MVSLLFQSVRISRRYFERAIRRGVVCSVASPVEEVSINGKRVNSLKMVELREELMKRNLKKSGSKPELIERLQKVLSEENRARKVLHVDGQPLDALPISDLRLQLFRRRLLTTGGRAEMTERLKAFLESNLDKGEKTVETEEVQDDIGVFYIPKSDLIYFNDKFTRLFFKGFFYDYTVSPDPRHNGTVKVSICFHKEAKVKTSMTRVKDIILKIIEYRKSNNPGCLEICAPPHLVPEHLDGMFYSQVQGISQCVLNDLESQNDAIALTFYGSNKKLLELQKFLDVAFHESQITETAVLKDFPAEEYGRLKIFKRKIELFTNCNIVLYFHTHHQNKYDVHVKAIGYDFGQPWLAVEIIKAAFYKN